MCEVQENGSLGVVGDKRESVAPGRLSVSSSGSDEDRKTPRNSLLGPNDEGPPGLPSEETSNSHKDSSAMEAFEVPHVTSSKMEDENGETGDIKMDEEEKEEVEEVREKTIEEEEQVVKKMECEEVEEGKELADEKGSESEAQEVLKDGVCDETERENLENERRDENKQKLESAEDTVKVQKVEITLRMEREIKEEKTTDEEEAEEENTHGNEEQVASSPDSPKAEEEIKVEEEEEEKEREKQEQIENKDGHEEKNRAEEVEDKDKEEEKEKEETGDKVGDIPFRQKTTKDASTTRKVTKTVNFLDTELKKQLEDNLAKRNTINATSSVTSHSKSKEDEDEEHLTRLEGEAEEKTSRQWTLGEGNPVYRLSLKLSPNLFNTTDIPGANQHKEVDKSGFLTKLSGRSFISQWKRRYCVLSKGRLYYYEREDSKAGDKSNGVIQLEYFDQVAEAGPKECKKATNVFIIASQDRSFFDPGRHIFSADTLPDMKDWIRRLQAALDQIRNNNRPAASTSPSASPAKEGKRRRDEAAEGKESKASQQNSSSKDRKKKKEESGRGRKSSRVGVSSQTQTSMVEPTTEVDGGRPSTVTPKGGVMLPGFSSRKDPQTIGKTVQRSDEGQEDLPQAGPTLTSITKQRVKGPQGRRAPQNRRMAAAAALKKRASSLSALEHQDTADNRSEGSDGATRSSRNSQTPEGDLKAETESEEENERKKLKTEPLDEKEEEIQDHTAERQFKIDNVDDGLFFKSGLKEGVILKGGSEGEGQKNRRSGGLKVNFEETPASPTKNGTLGKFFRFSSKRKKYETKETLMPDHPDMVNNSRWTCVVL